MRSSSSRYPSATRAFRIAVALTIAFALPGIVGLAHARARRVLVHVGIPLAYKPHEFAVSGDGDFFVKQLRWHSWGGRKAVASGLALERVSPGKEVPYPARVTLSRRTYCRNLHRTVYNKIVARITGPNPGVFGTRTAGRVYTCAGTWRLT